MKFDEIVERISTQGRRKNDKQMVEITLLYYGSILFNRYDRYKEVSNLKSHVNFYGMVFGSSGIGKGFIIGIIEKLCNLEHYSDQYISMYEFFTEDIGAIEPDNNVKKFIPTSTTISVNGSAEGLYSVARAVDDSGFGSINLIFEEIMDILTSSSNLLNMLKLMYDSTVQAKVIKGNIDSKREKDITGIVANLLIAGSNDSVDKDTQEHLNRLAKSGMYRRSYVIDSDLEPTRNNIKPMSLEPIELWFKKLNYKNKEMYNDRIDAFNKLPDLSLLFKIDDNALEYIETIDDALMERASDDRLDIFKKYDVGALNTIVNAAYIIAYIEMCDSVKIEHIKKAYSIFINTRNTTSKTFQEKSSHDEIYDILKIKDNLTQTDLLSLSSSDTIPSSKNQFKDAMLLVQELAYRHGEELIRNDGVVVRYSIKPLPITNLNKLIFSLSTDDNLQKAIAYEPVEMRWSDIEKLAKSHFRIEIDEDGEEVQLGIQSFCLAHYNESKKTEPLGHRGKDYFIQGQNVIAFDMDEGITTISEVRQKFSHVKHIVYTTKSHNSLKSEYKDRFRLIIPCKTKYSVNPEQHKQMYRNVAEFFDIYPDIKAYNVSRLLFTNKDAEIHIGDSDELFDIQPFIPDTESSKLLLDKLKNFKTLDLKEDYDEISSRINGIIKYYLATLHVGNLKDTIHKLFTFVKELTNDDTMAKEAIETLRNGSGYPHRFNEQYLSDHRIK